MSPNFAAGIVFSLFTFFVLPSTVNAATAKARQNQINKTTKELKRLPERGASSARISALVKKLVKLQPDTTTQYYLLGLRKLGVPGQPGKDFAKRLNKSLQKLIARSDLSEKSKNFVVRRLNKAQRLFVPPFPESAPAPYTAMLLQRHMPTLD